MTNERCKPERTHPACLDRRLPACRTLLACTLFLTLSFSLSLPARAADVVEVPTAASLLQQGTAAYQKGDYASAIRYLAARARMAPEDANVYYYLGNCYVQLKQNDQAAHMYSAAVRTSPTSQAGQYSLKALESLSAMPKADPKPAAVAPDPAAVEAAHDGLVTEAPLDKAFNDASKRIKNDRYNFKGKVDKFYDNLQNDMMSLSRRSPTYQIDLERMRRQAEIDIEYLQTSELRHESRILAPDKVDVRAVPQLPQEKIDDAKNALGTLSDYLHPEKPFDPFAADITPEQTAKFMSVRDVFGDLSTFQPPARKLAKQLFGQLKAAIETKQDSFDSEVKRLKRNLLTDILDIKQRDVSSGSTNSQSPFRQNTPEYQLSQTKTPRTDQTYLTPTDIEISQATEKAKKRLQELQDDYVKAVDIAISGAKERLGSVVAAGSMDSQLKHPSGTIQIVPQGTDLYTRNYVNFGDHPDADATVKHTVTPSQAHAQKWQGSKDK